MRGRSLLFLLDRIAGVMDYSTQRLFREPPCFLTSMEKITFYHPFTAPEVKPRTIYFCRKKYRIRGIRLNKTV